MQYQILLNKSGRNVPYTETTLVIGADGTIEAHVNGEIISCEKQTMTTDQINALAATLREEMAEGLANNTLDDMTPAQVQEIVQAAIETAQEGGAVLATKEEVTELGETLTAAINEKQAAGDYVTRAAADGAYQPLGAYALQSEIPTVDITKSQADAAYQAKGVSPFANDWCVAYDPYSRAISAGKANNPTPITFYKVGNNVPSTSNITLDGSVVYGSGSGKLRVKNAGVYVVTGRIQMAPAGSDTSVIIQMNSDNEANQYLNRFTIPKGSAQGQLSTVFVIPANSTVNLGLISTDGITTTQNPFGTTPGNNSMSVSCSLTIFRIA
jgi:hypothetical protein